MQGTDLQRLRFSQLNRRRFLIGAGVITGGIIATQWTQRVVAQPRFSGYPFSLGVASGDPLPDGVVLWTRLAPEPLNGGGMPSVNVPVQWQIASDENMRKVVRRGVAMATPEFAHSVHVDVGGLEPERWYWYQFKVGNEVSQIGRTRTAPAPDARVAQFRFGVANCQDWQNGYYTAYYHLAKEELDLIVHLGDYIYEYGPETGGPRQHNSPEIFTLEDYRNRHALYKTDPNLQAAHAAFPWIFTWDDHEVENNYAGFIPEENQSPEEFVTRRANGYQAYYEHMPLRPSSRPQGPNLLLYRRFKFGDIAEFNVLDTRQYRTDQPCGDGAKPRCPEAFSPDATMTGTEQERWLFQGLSQSQARWNVIAQQTMMAEYDFNALPKEEVFNLDQWDGYVLPRNRLLEFIRARRPSNPVVITGDIHSSWVHDLKTDFNNPNSPTVATEFVATAISSEFPQRFIPIAKAALRDNPHTQFFDGEFRGYMRCHLTKDTWQNDFRVVSTIREQNATVSTLASFIVQNGQPGAKSFE
jgi:alkaline phosphatase D